MELTRANRTDLLTEIPEDGFCKTFADSVIAARELGIKYLWIDRLCIIQHDDEDWLNESSKMRDVYSNAFLNLAATSAQDGDEGMFTERNPLLFKPCVVQTSWEGDYEQFTGIYKLLEQKSTDTLRTSSDETPLNSRAWVVQERYLSRRILHFCEGQLCWECCEKTHCELEPELDAFPPDSLDRNWRAQLSDVRENVKSISGLWCHIMAIYSKCGLTNSRDKFPALAGITEDFEPFLGDNIAGLWASQMENQLLWITRGECRRPDRYRAPSWSWGSLENEIYYSYIKTHRGKIVLDDQNGKPTERLAESTHIPIDMRWSLENNPEDRALKIKGQ